MGRILTGYTAAAMVGPGFAFVFYSICIYRNK